MTWLEIMHAKAPSAAELHRRLVRLGHDVGERTVRRWWAGEHPPPRAMAVPVADALELVGDAREAFRVAYLEDGEP